MKKPWGELVLRNFDNASVTYNHDAYLQKLFANKLAKECSKNKIPDGIWADLGSGTGLLANKLEELHNNHSVIRVDGSKQMLSQHLAKSKIKLWDLNLGLPKWSEQPSLIASNFALHWLQNPAEKLKEWFSALAPGGLLAVAVPIQGSFPEWHQAALSANVECTANTFPSRKSLIKVLDSKKIKFEQVEKFTQEAPDPSSLLKPLIKIGAKTSTKPSLSVGSWRKLLKNWPESDNNQKVHLTWLIQILLAQK